MRKILGLATIGIVGLNGCAGSLTGFDGESRFACKAPDGVTCSSLTGIYANAVANNLPALRRERRDERVAGSRSPEGVITGRAASTGEPLRVQPRILRLWIAPWEDAEGDLHDQAFTYIVASPGGWAIEHGQRQIVDRYRPTFPALGAQPGPAAKQSLQTQRPTSIGTPLGRASAVGAPQVATDAVVGDGE